MRPFLFLLLALPLVTSAQPIFGVKSGLSVANLYGFDDLEDVGDKSPVLGFTGGVMAQLPLSPSLAVRPEVLFTMKGTQLSSDIMLGESTIESKQTIRIHYVEIPVMARIALPVGPFADAGLLAGPSVGFKVSESNKTEVDGVETDRPVDDIATSFDAGVAVGAEYGSGPFAVEARYMYGLVGINKNDDTVSIRNGVFSITGAFRFGQ
ncbi:MAG: porin family protein [Rubricoccaceae bacterium]